MMKCLYAWCVTDGTGAPFVAGTVNYGDYTWDGIIQDSGLCILVALDIVTVVDHIYIIDYDCYIMFVCIYLNEHFKYKSYNIILCV